MKRLTKRCNGVVTYIGASNEYETGQIACEVESQGVRELLERLASYEDTGLTPEEIMAMQHTLDEYHKRADPLLMAQADGRVVVLPCKVGGEVYSKLDNLSRLHQCRVTSVFISERPYVNYATLEPVDYESSQYGATFGAFGKTVFLTREEAEKALRRTENG